MTPIDYYIHLDSIYLKAAIYIVLAPLLGGLLAGVDRKLSARMQGRVGPPVLQPFYDVLKLFQKEKIIVNKFQNFNVILFFVFMVFTGSLFFLGGDLLLVIFALTLAGVFFALAGFSVNSPYCHVGAERELIQMMSYDPMIILVAVGIYQVTGTFRVDAIALYDEPLILYLPGVFLGYLHVLTIKLRKSPFDLSMSAHAHQELVSGLKTEFSGTTLALIEVGHWYENVLLLGIIYLFFSFNSIVGLTAMLVLYFFEIVIDNTYARFKWELTFKSTWVVTALFGAANIIILYFAMRP